MALHTSPQHPARSLDSHERATSPWPSARAAAPWPESLSPEAAHELRLSDLAEVEGDRFDVIVIGAGIAGLTATTAAAATGARVLALDAAPAIGSRRHGPQRGHPQRRHQHDAG